MLTSLWNPPIPYVAWTVVVVASLMAAVTDLHNRRIPNWLTFPVLVGGLIWSGATAGWMGLADALVGCVMLAFPFIVLFVFAQGGAGDAKLMGAIGAWLGMINGMIVLAAVMIAGMILGILLALARQRVQTVLANVGRFIVWALYWLVSRGRLGQPPISQKNLTRMPYGVAICAGVCLAAGVVLSWLH